MIAGQGYLCCSANVPALATRVCWQARCTLCAFVCARNDCDCQATHKGHTMMKIDDAMEMAKKEINLQSGAAKSHEEICDTLDNLAQAVEQMKSKHKSSTVFFNESKMKSGSLRWKLGGRRRRWGKKQPVTSSIH